MNKFRGVIFFCILGLASPGEALANFLYSYTGNSFTSFFPVGSSNVFYPSSNLELSFVVAAELPTNLSYQDVGASVLSYNFVGTGGVPLTESNSFIKTFNVSTDALGNIIPDWDLIIETPATVGEDLSFVRTRHRPSVGTQDLHYQDMVCTSDPEPDGECNGSNFDSGSSQAANSSNPGTWTMQDLTPTYTVEGTVTGLTALGLVLQINGGDDLDVFTNGNFFFSGTMLDDGSAYAVTVLTNPPGQTCSVTNGSGTISGANVTDVIVNCADDPVATYSVGGTVSGLTGSVTLQNNVGDDIIKTTNDDFAFPTELLDLATYAVTVSSQPTGQTCSVTNGSGTIAAADVTNVAVTCVDDVAPTYSVGGTVSGLDCGGPPGCLWLENNGVDDLYPSNGSFTFGTELADGSGYSVTVAGKPGDQTCTVTNGSGTIATADVTNVAVTCVTDVVPPVDPPAPATPVPTMSQWALIMLSMFLGLMVFANRRRLF